MCSGNSVDDGVHSVWCRPKRTTVDVATRVVSEYDESDAMRRHQEERDSNAQFGDAGFLRNGNAETSNLGLPFHISLMKKRRIIVVCEVLTQ